MDKYRIELTVDQLSTLQEIVTSTAITRETDIEYDLKHYPEDIDSIKLMQPLAKEARELSNYLQNIPF
jgi:hypothetical protein